MAVELPSRTKILLRPGEEKKSTDVSLQETVLLEQQDLRLIVAVSWMCQFVLVTFLPAYQLFLSPCCISERARDIRFCGTIGDQAGCSVTWGYGAVCHAVRV